MSTPKTIVSNQTVKKLLKDNIDDEFSDLLTLKGGERSQAFSFSTYKGSFVLRIAKEHRDDFEKDSYAYNNFASHYIPIPKILRIGKFSNYKFAISEKLGGKMLVEFADDEVTKLLPSITTSLDSIHNSRTDIGNKYGVWDKDGLAKQNSWEEVILEYFNEKNKNWNEEFGNTFYDRTFFNNLYSKAERLTKYVPNRHDLLHGDYGFDNVLSDGKIVTGVLDWGSAKYGDFLYDIARLIYWGQRIDYEGFFKKHYKGNSEAEEHWDEKIACYILWIAAKGLGFYAMSDQKSSYDVAKIRIEYFLSRSK